jgi:SAM-dependent methyltransferase
MRRGTKRCAAVPISSGRDKPALTRGDRRCRSERMADVDSLVQRQYARGGMLERLFAALVRDGRDPEKLAVSDLWRYDQLHTRGVEATRDHVERAGLRAHMHVLDLGCGVGGSSRYIAATIGCRVTGIDLTQECVDAAEELTRRCGLAGRIAYRQASALALPFAEGTFDHVYSHNVTMNIPDKRGLAAEVARVLRRGGRFSCSELGRCPGARIVYPMPWASDAEASFLATPGEMRAALEAGGLRIVEEIDLSEINRAGAKDAIDRHKRGEPPLQMNEIVMGEDFRERGRNSTRAVMDGSLVETLFIAEKP